MLGLFLASVALSASLVGMSVLTGEADLDIAEPGPVRSLRFWILSFLGFGLAGMPLSMLAVEPLLSLVVAAGAGAALGRVMWPLFEESSCDTSLAGLQGAEGRALVPISAGAGRIVVQTLAERFELPARSGDGSRIPVGRPVLVTHVDDGVAEVVAI